MKFLLIDDDSDDRVLFREALEEVSPETICVTEGDGRKALSELIDSKQLPDLIFVDINMPRISGWDCLEKIKAQQSTKDIPVIMYTTSSLERDVERACRSGAAGLLTKPADYCELKRCLTELVRSLVEKTPLSIAVANYML